MGLLATILSAVGCATKLKGGEIGSSDNAGPGLRYYVPMDMLLVTGEVTRRATRGIFEDPNGISLGNYEEVATGQVDLKPVPDHSRTFVLHMEPGGTADNTLDVTLKSSGQPSKINLISTDRSAEIVASTVKFAARIAATAAGIPPIGVAAVDPPLRDVFTALEGPAVLRALYRRWSEADQRYDASLEEVRAAEIVLRDPEASDEERAEAKEKLQVAQESVTRFDDLRGKARTELLTEYEAFKTRQRVGAVEDKRTFSYALTLEDAKAAGRLAIAPGSIDSIDALLAPHPQMKAMWDHVGVIVTATEVSAPAGAVDAAHKYVYSAQKDKTKTPIFYRSAKPMLISVWVKDVLLNGTDAGQHAMLGVTDDEVALANVARDQDPLTDFAAAFEQPETPAPTPAPAPAPAPQGGARLVKKTAQLRLASQAVLDVRDTTDPVRFVAFDEKAFSTQNVDIGFDDRGNLITFKRTGTSNVAAFTKALADAVENLPKEYQAGVTALGGAASEGDKQAAAIATARKQAVDAETERLNSEIKLLEAQKRYRDAQDAANGAPPPPAPAGSPNP